MKMRKRFATLVAWLMLLSLFTTGYATTITLYPPTITNNITPPGTVSGPTIGNNHQIGPDYFGVSWKMSGNNIEGSKFSYDEVWDTVNGSKYSYRNTSLSVRLNVLNSVRTSRELQHYNSDCLVIHAIISNVSTDTANPGVTRWNDNCFEYFRVPTAATVGVSDGTVFEKVPVTVSDDTLVMRIPIAMLYRLAAAQKGATSTNTSTLAVWLEFDELPVSPTVTNYETVLATKNANIEKLCNPAKTSISFKMATDYYYEK